MYHCSICIAEKEIRLCENIAKFLQNLPFQLAKFCILDAKFEIFFCKKLRGQICRFNLIEMLMIFMYMSCFGCVFLNLFAMSNKKMHFQIEQCLIMITLHEKL